MIFATLLWLFLLRASRALPTATCPDGIHSAVNPQCCFWANVRDRFINEVFLNICGDNVHSLGGGADGSIILFKDTELAYSANAGIDYIVGFLQPFADAVGIGYGDAIHFGAAVGLSLCPGAPRIPAFVGRPNATVAAPDNTVPEPFDAPIPVFARMGDAGFSPEELVHLLAAHSIADQNTVDPEAPGAPFDSTPFSFDSQFFLETTLFDTLFPGSGPNPGEAQSPLAGEVRLITDRTFARNSLTACAWQENALNQTSMAANFKSSFTKLSLLGQDSASLLDCSELIAEAPPTENPQAFFPSGKGRNDIQQSCNTAAFPTTLSTADPAKGTSIRPVSRQVIAFGPQST